MSDCSVPEIDFPTDYMFKVFGKADAGETFRLEVKRVINSTTSCPDDAIRIRLSSGGKYLCVTALTHLTSRDQMLAIYEELNTIDGLMFLL